MWQQLMASFAAGLSVGPVCVLHCGVFHGAFLARHAHARRRDNALLGAALLTGRLGAYLLFGLLLGLVATSGVVAVKPAVLTFILGCLMLAYAVLPRRKSKRCACGPLSANLVGGAALLGFVSGLSPCPPFLASGLIALRSHGVGSAILTLLAFFAGSSIFLLPFWFWPAALGQRFRERLRALSRVIAGCVALYAFGSLAGSPRTPHRPPTQLGGPDAMPAGIGALAQQGQAEEETPRVSELSKADVPPPAPPDVVPLFPKEPPTRRFTASILQRLQLSLKEAMYYTPLEDGSVSCDLCPTGCVLENGEQGMCRARVNIDGKMRSIVYGRPVSINVDPIEKKPLFHVLPASKAFSLATAGCNLGCVFCQNFEISQAAPEETRRYNVPPAKLVALSKEHGCEGIAYTYTEPTVFYEYMLDTATLAHASKLKNYWVTCGQIEEAPLLELCKVLDAANVDLKGFSDEFYVKYCSAHLFPVLRTLKTLKAQNVFFEITNLLIPGGNDDEAMIRDMCQWIVKELGPDVPLHFSRFHPAYKLTRRPATPVATLKMAREIAKKEGIRYVYLGNVRGSGLSDTFCPICSKTLIQRSGYLVTENHIKDKRCEFCGAPVAGIWK